MMIVRKLEVGPFASNCYIVGDQSGGNGIIIDPGAEADMILKTADGLGLKVQLIVLTHGHMDHVGALPEVKKTTGADIAVHSEDARSLQVRNPFGLIVGGASQSVITADRLLSDGDIILIGDQPLTVLHTPGHTPGGISIAAEGLVFTGDTLFNLGIGRTDMPGGSYDQLMASIQTKLMVLPDDTVVYPGHGPETTIAKERQLNPWL